MRSPRASGATSLASRLDSTRANAGRNRTWPGSRSRASRGLCCVARVIVAAPDQGLDTAVETVAARIDRHAAAGATGDGIRRRLQFARVARQVRPEVSSAVSVLVGPGALRVVSTVNDERGDRVPALAVYRRGHWRDSLEAPFATTQELHDELRPGAVPRGEHPGLVHAIVVEQVAIPAVEARRVGSYAPAAPHALGKHHHVVVRERTPRVRSRI